MNFGVKRYLLLHTYNIIFYYITNTVRVYLLTSTLPYHSSYDSEFILHYNFFAYETKFLCLKF